MAAKKGHEKAGGRKKGTPNKTTAAVKAALMEAFDELGGIAALVKWAKTDLGEFYKLWAKLLPTEIKNADSQALKIQLVEEIISDLPDPQPSDHNSGGQRITTPLTS